MSVVKLKFKNFVEMSFCKSFQIRKIREIKDPQNLSAIRYAVDRHLKPHGYFGDLLTDS